MIEFRERDVFLCLQLVERVLILRADVGHDEGCTVVGGGGCVL